MEVSRKKLVKFMINDDNYDDGYINGYHDAQYESD